MTAAVPHCSIDYHPYNLQVLTSVNISIFRNIDLGDLTFYGVTVLRVEIVQGGPKNVRLCFKI